MKYIYFYIFIYIFFPYKNIFSANNVYFVKNIFFQKKNFFFNLVLQQMNNHTRMCSIIKDVPKTFHKIHRKTPLKYPLFNKSIFNLLKRRPWRRCFPVNFVKFLRIPFLQNTSGRLLLTKP